MPTPPVSPIAVKLTTNRRATRMKYLFWKSRRIDSRTGTVLSESFDSSVFRSFVPKNVIRIQIMPAMPKMTDMPVHPNSFTIGVVTYEIRIMTAYTKM